MQSLHYIQRESRDSRVSMIFVSPSQSSFSIITARAQVSWNAAKFPLQPFLLMSSPTYGLSSYFIRGGCFWCVRTWLGPLCPASPRTLQAAPPLRLPLMLHAMRWPQTAVWHGEWSREPLLCFLFDSRRMQKFRAIPYFSHASVLHSEGCVDLSQSKSRVLVSIFPVVIATFKSAKAGIH